MKSKIQHHCHRRETILAANTHPIFISQMGFPWSTLSDIPAIVGDIYWVHILNWIRTFFATCGESNCDWNRNGKQSAWRAAVECFNGFAWCRQSICCTLIMCYCIRKKIINNPKAASRRRNPNVEQFIGGKTISM